MIRHVNPYFSLNEILLRITGLWPFQRPKFARIQFSLFFSIMTATVIFQLTLFVTSKCTPRFVLKVLSSTVSFIIVLIYYSSFYINIESVKNLLAELHHICDQLKNKNEIAIIEKYSNRGKRFTIVIAALSASFVSALLVGQLIPGLFNIILSTNKSRSQRLYITMEYFLDQEKYFYLFLFHINITICIEIAVTIAIGTMFIAYLQYTCGMLRIASYRIEYAMEGDMIQDISLKNGHLMYKEIVCAVNIHRQATKLSTLLISNFDTTYFFLVIISVISLSLNLLQIAIFQNNIPEILLPALIICFIIIYFFLGNYIGQHITDHHNYVFATVYDIQWYLYPLHIQKLVLFLLQRGVREFHLTCGGLFVASFECFAMLMKASVSYFTVIYSMQ
ncbi:hypothetical protein HN011_000958 [Eciton burchellii]|nr:hypothetical protein HN011_000958 [Eciton burchellii]